MKQTKKRLKEIKGEKILKKAQALSRIVRVCDKRMEEIKLENFQLIHLREQANEMIANPHKNHDWSAWDLKDEDTRKTLLHWI